MRRIGSDDLSSVGKWVLIATLIGLVGGVAAVIFEEMIAFVADHVLRGPAHVDGEGASGALGWRILLFLGVPAAGGFVAVLLSVRFAPDAQGHGTEAMIRSFHERDGAVPRPTILVKAVSSAVTIGSGGSGGQEGPVAQIGAGLGSAVADGLRLPHRDRRIFLLSGASAGVGALFCAPLGGALFAPEVLYRKPEYEGEAIIPCIIASIVAYTTRTAITGRSQVLEIDSGVRAALEFEDWRQLLIYLVLALTCAAVSFVYVRAFKGIHAGFERLPFARPLRGALGGLLLGVLALAIAPLAGDNGVFFGGYGLMQSSIAGDLGVGLLLLLIAAKVIGTSLTIGSGGSGGLFAPSLAIGALTGAAVGKAAAELFPGLGLEPACFAFVGMGGFFAGVAKTPIASIILVCEMTGSYGLLAPLMLVSVLHLLLASRWSIYDTQVAGLVDSPAHAGEFVVDVLERMRVKDLLERFSKPTLVSENTTLRKALDVVSASRSTYFPVVDKEERLVGIFGLTDIRRIFREDEIADLVIVRDFMVEDVATVTPEDSLNDALQRLNERAIAQIPVVDAHNPRRVLGMLSRNNLGAAYHQRLRELRRLGSG